MIGKGRWFHDVLVLVGTQFVLLVQRTIREYGVLPLPLGEGWGEGLRICELFPIGVNLRIVARIETWRVLYALWRNPGRTRVSREERSTRATGPIRFACLS